MKKRILDYLLYIWIGLWIIWLFSYLMYDSYVPPHDLSKSLIKLWNGRYHIGLTDKNVTICDTSIISWCLRDYIISQKNEEDVIYIYFHSLIYDIINNDFKKKNEKQFWYELFWWPGYSVNKFEDIPVFLRLNFITDKKEFFWSNLSKITNIKNREIFQELVNNPVLIINWKRYEHYNYQIN